MTHPDQSETVEFVSGRAYAEESVTIPVTLDGQPVGEIRVRAVHDEGDPLPFYADARFVRESSR